MERGSGGCKLPRGPQGHRTGPDGSVELVGACVFGPRAGPQAMHLVTNDGVRSRRAYAQAERPPNLDQKREVDFSRCQPSWFIAKAALQRLTGANPSHSNVKVTSTQISALRLTSPAAMVSTSPRALCACHKIHDRKQAGRCSDGLSAMKQPIAVVTRTCHRLHREPCRARRGDSYPH